MTVSLILMRAMFVSKPALLYHGKTIHIKSSRIASHVADLRVFSYNATAAKTSCNLAFCRLPPVLSCPRYLFIGFPDMTSFGIQKQ